MTVYLKLLIEQLPECKEVEIKITCKLIDNRLKRLIEQIQLYSFTVMAKKDGLLIPVPLEEIYYFDAVDSKVFLYKDQEVYLCSKKLYELEELLSDTPFVRISKNCILNTAFVESVKAQFSGRLEATLSNKEKLIISKHYLPEFREKFMK